MNWFGVSKSVNLGPY